MKRTVFCLILAGVLMFSGSGFAEAAVPAPAGPDVPAAEPAENPAAGESAGWYADYLALLSDDSAREALIGDATVYRTGYFSYDPEALHYQSWRLADLSGDGIPELLLTTAVGLTDLFTWQDGPVYIGYDHYFGFLPGTGLAVVHGHWHGAGGSQRDEWTVSNPFRSYEERPIASFDHLGGWYVWEDGVSIREDSEEAKGAYEDAVRRYVDPCVRLADIPAHGMDELETLSAPADLSEIPTCGELKASYPVDCSIFLLGYGWWAKAEFLRNSEYPVLLTDMDGDGIPELLIQSGCREPGEADAYVFCRRAGKARFVPVGTVPTDLRISDEFGEMYGRTERGGEDVWSEYSLSMSGDSVQAFEMTWLQDAPAEPDFTEPVWSDMRKLSEALCNPDPENAYRITVVSGDDLVDFCPATASAGSVVPVLTMDVTDGSMRGGGAEDGKWMGCFYVFTMPDHDVELHFSFHSNGLA